MTDHLINLRVDEAREWAGSGSFDCTDLAQAWGLGHHVADRLRREIPVSRENAGRINGIFWELCGEVDCLWETYPDPKDAARALTLAAVEAAEQLQGVTP